MKKRAPTLPPTIIDRGLSMIAIRVTFSRACARARKKKSDIICARKCAQMRARESEEEMKKKCVFLIHRYKSFSFLSPNFPCFFFFCDEENKRRERIRKKRVFSSSVFGVFVVVTQKHFQRKITHTTNTLAAFNTLKTPYISTHYLHIHTNVFSSTSLVFHEQTRALSIRVDELFLICWFLSFVFFGRSSTTPLGL